MKRLLFLAMVFLVVSCEVDPVSPGGTGSGLEDGRVEGYRPVYMAPQQAKTIEVTGVEPLENPGKIFWYHNFMMLTDQRKGVHIIDISNPANPQKLNFISIPGVNDVAVKSSYLYADNITDLVVLDISNVYDISFETRVNNVYPATNQMYPQHATGYFECVDTTKGLVVGWEKTMLEDPKCRR